MRKQTDLFELCTMHCTSQIFRCCSGPFNVCSMLSKRKVGFTNPIQTGGKGRPRRKGSEMGRMTRWRINYSKNSFAEIRTRSLMLRRLQSKSDSGTLQQCVHFRGESDGSAWPHKRTLASKPAWNISLGGSSSCHQRSLENAKNTRPVIQ